MWEQGSEHGQKGRKFWAFGEEISAVWRTLAGRGLWEKYEAKGRLEAFVPGSELCDAKFWWKVGIQQEMIDLEGDRFLGHWGQRYLIYLEQKPLMPTPCLWVSRDVLSVH